MSVRRLRVHSFVCRPFNPCSAFSDVAASQPSLAIRISTRKLLAVIDHFLVVAEFPPIIPDSLDEDHSLGNHCIGTGHLQALAAICMDYEMSRGLIVGITDYNTLSLRKNTESI